MALVEDWERFDLFSTSDLRLKMPPYYCLVSALVLRKIFATFEIVSVALLVSFNLSCFTCTEL